MFSASGISGGSARIGGLGDDRRQSCSRLGQFCRLYATHDPVAAFVTRSRFVSSHLALLSDMESIGLLELYPGIAGQLSMRKLRQWCFLCGVDMAKVCIQSDSYRRSNKLAFAARFGANRQSEMQTLGNRSGSFVRCMVHMTDLSIRHGSYSHTLPTL